ncbi:MAG: DNA repair protein RadC [Kiloniellales bacterium]|nr:DNA repair protein RadC [Kiloniellales bacterium]
MSASKPQQAKPHYHGHRDRLRQRLLDQGGGALADYEIIEFLLFAAAPRADTKPLAKALIKRFGSLSAVLSAEPAELAAVSGLGQASIAALKIVPEAARRLAREQVLGQPVLSSWSKLLDYCRIALAHEKVERFHLLFLDRQNRLIADETQQRGTVDHTPVYPREVVRRALELGATALILVHNHPSGDPTPSKADIEMTREIAAAGEKLGISVHDHVVIGRSGETSFKAAGLL